MLSSPHKLAYKITGILLVFFLFAATAIGLTLVVSWQLEGGAAAINDAGSQRMRSYRIAQLLAQAVPGNGRLSTLAASEIGAEIERFEQVLRDLEVGDPARPLSPPRDTPVFEGVRTVRQQWSNAIRPLLNEFLAAADASGRARARSRYDDEVVRFVGEINELVLRMEHNYAFNTNLLRTFQVVLAAFAVLGTMVMIRFFFVLVIRPVDSLYDGLRRMAGNELTVRLPVQTRDEFGVLATGFNRMAEHLEEVYGTLEQRVVDKTRTLASKNSELALLYEIAAFLQETGSVEEVCQGFIERLKEHHGARAGSVRLYSSHSDELFLLSHVGLSEQFVGGELALRCGDCVCGEALRQSTPVTFDVERPPAGMTLRNCLREGFRTVTAFTVSHNKKTMGVFNLYFDGPREFSPQEVFLLETLGQHLGVAVENQRLQAREKELAVFEERNLLAQELHDSIAQGLASLNIQVQLLRDSLRREKVDEALQTADHLHAGVQESYEDVRELLVYFRTRMHQTDLDTAILTALERFEAQTGQQTSFERVGSGPPLSPEADLQVLHIVQESLSNIRKHAHATVVDVRVERGVRGLTIEVADNGLGFDPEAPPPLDSERHVGLRIMKERAHRVGGQCQVKSTIGAGTAVTFSLARVQREAA